MIFRLFKGTRPLKCGLFVFCLCWHYAVYSASSIKFIHFLVTDSNLVEALAKNGIRGQEANYVKTSVANSLKALSTRRNQLDTQTLRTLLDQLPVSGRDVQLRAELLRIIETPSEQVSPDDFVQAINHLIYLSNRYSLRSSSVLSCSECVSGALAARGFKFTMEEVLNQQSKKVLTEILPQDPRELRQFIQTRMRRYEFGDFSKATTDIVGQEEERSLALFLGLKEFGSPSQKNFISAVEQISRNDAGMIDLLSKQRSHKLWRLFSEDMSDEQLEGFTKLMREVDQESRGKNVSLNDAFFRVLQRKAGDDIALQERASQLQRKNCFFQ